MELELSVGLGSSGSCGHKRLLDLFHSCNQHPEPNFSFETSCVASSKDCMKLVAFAYALDTKTKVVDTKN